jgi:8-oxo-dGTP pyrophosphatase MutT (NUDIX family)
VASRAETWRLRVRAGLAELPPEPDPAGRLLERVIGVPSRELLADLAAPRRDAAVLLGLIDRHDGPSVLLTERAAHLAQHPGQISLPGGGLERPDEDPVAAALREAAEEVGLAAQQIEVWGRMPMQLTVTGFRVTPVVGWIEPGFVARADPAEVQAVFEVPLSHLLAPGNRQREIHERGGDRILGDVFIYDRYRIWGATAAILAGFIEILHGKT